MSGARPTRTFVMGRECTETWAQRTYRGHLVRELRAAQARRVAARLGARVVLRGHGGEHLYETEPASVGHSAEVPESERAAVRRVVQRSISREER